MTTINPLSAIPDAMYRGDTWFFELKDSLYPASDWSMSVYLSSPIGIETLTSSANGTAHRFNVAATATDAFEPGEYEYQIRAEHSSDGRVFTVGEGTIEILLPKTEQGDHRHRVKRILDALDAVLEGKANNDHLATAVNGKSVSRMSVEEIRQFRAWYAQQWQSLTRKRRKTAFGKSRQSTVKARFG